MAIINPPPGAGIPTPPAPMDPDLANDPSAQPHSVTPRVVVRFADGFSLAPDEARLGDVLPNGHVSGALRQAVLRSGHAPLTGAQLRTLMARAAAETSNYPAPNLLNYRWLAAQDKAQAVTFAEQLRTLPEVVTAYVRPPPVPPPQQVQAYNDVLSGQQRYLDPAPEGIDARFAWDESGGSGRAQKMADIEWGWNLAHFDLAAHHFLVINGDAQQALWHGTSVLGVIASLDNDHHCVGIVPHVAAILAVAQNTASGDYWTHEAVLAAIHHLSAGDVMLLEAQTIMYGEELIPLEAEPQVFEYLQLAHALGIVVVEAAGNGGVDLDSVTDWNGVSIFSRKVRDSGAIIVGSAEPDSKPQWQRRYNSCFGDRVDCFAQGDGVVTLTSDYGGTLLDQWTDAFADTSAASAIVAGAALALQGVAFARYNHRLDPTTVRKFLADGTLNTPSADPGKDGIGVMPDLGQIIGSLPATWP